MSDDVTFAFSHTIGGTTFRASKCDTPLEAQMAVRQMAVNAGYTLPVARTKWWQFWRPKRGPMTIPPRLLGGP